MIMHLCCVLAQPNTIEPVKVLRQSSLPTAAVHMIGKSVSMQHFLLCYEHLLQMTLSARPLDYVLYWLSIACVHRWVEPSG